MSKLTILPLAATLLVCGLAPSTHAQRALAAPRVSSSMVQYAAMRKASRVSASTVAAELRRYRQSPHRIARILFLVRYNTASASRAMVVTLRETDSDAPAFLISSGYSAAAVTTSLLGERLSLATIRSGMKRCALIGKAAASAAVTGLRARRMTTSQVTYAMRLGGFPAVYTASALRSTYQLSVIDTAKRLRRAGFSARSSAIALIGGLLRSRQQSYYDLRYAGWYYYQASRARPTAKQLAEGMIESTPFAIAKAEKKNGSTPVEAFTALRDTGVVFYAAFDAVLLAYNAMSLQALITLGSVVSLEAEIYEEIHANKTRCIAALQSMLQAMIQRTTTVKQAFVEVLKIWYDSHATMAIYHDDYAADLDDMIEAMAAAAKPVEVVIHVIVAIVITIDSAMLMALRVAGYAALEVTAALKDSSELVESKVAEYVLSAGWTATQAVQAIKTVYQTTGAKMADYLWAVSAPAKDVGSALYAVYEATGDLIATWMRSSSFPEVCWTYAGVLWIPIPYPNVTARYQSVASWMLVAKFSLVEIVSAMMTVSKLTATEAWSIVNSL